MAIKQTKAGTWAAYFRDQYGKQVQETFDKKADATEWLIQSKAAARRGEYVRQSPETVKTIAEKWHQRKVEAGTYKRASLEQWRNHKDNFINVELGSLKVWQVDVEAIERAAAAWRERVSPATVNKILTTLTAVLDLAKRYRLIKENPAREAERLKLATADEDGEQVTEDQVYTKAEVKKLIEATEPGTVDRVFLMVSALLGLRIGETLALMWPAIDLKAGKLRVALNLADSAKGEEPLFQSPKTKSSRRTLALPQELVHELKRWKLACPTSARDLVFATVEGKAYHRKSASKMLDRAIEAAKLEKRLTPHGLRHTFASLLLADGRPAPEVGAYLGHKDSAVTLKVYAHFVREETGAVHDLASSILS
jgi:integrase